MRQVDVEMADRFALESTLSGRALLCGCLLVALGAAPIVSDVVARWLPEGVPSWGAPLCCIVGLIMLAYRRGAIVDRDAETVTRWWGVRGIPVYRQDQPLRASAVQISKITHVDGEGLDETKYPIALVSPGSRAVLVSGHTVSTTWSLATRLAEFLDVDLEDRTGDEVRTLNPFRS